MNSFSTFCNISSPTDIVNIIKDISLSEYSDDVKRRLIITWIRLVYGNSYKRILNLGNFKRLTVSFLCKMYKVKDLKEIRISSDNNLVEESINIIPTVERFISFNSKSLLLKNTVYIKSIIDEFVNNTELYVFLQFITGKKKTGINITTELVNVLQCPSKYYLNDVFKYYNIELKHQNPLALCIDDYNVETSLIGVDRLFQHYYTDTGLLVKVIDKTHKRLLKKQVLLKFVKYNQFNQAHVSKLSKCNITKNQVFYIKKSIEAIGITAIINTNKQIIVKV